MVAFIVLLVLFVMFMFMWATRIAARTEWFAWGAVFVLGAIILLFEFRRYL